MRIILRFVLPLILLLALTGYAAIPLLQKMLNRWHSRDLDVRATLITHTLHISVDPLLQKMKQEDGGASQGIQKIFESALKDERLSGLAICEGPKEITSVSLLPGRDGRLCSLSTGIQSLGTLAFHISRLPFSNDGSATEIVIVHDISFALLRSSRIQNYLILFFVFLALVVSLLVAFLARFSYRSWFESMLLILRNPDREPRSIEAMQLRREVNHLVRQIERSRSIREEGTQVWSPATLREILRNDLTGDEILIVSNREPYIHVHDDSGSVRVQVPASGLVTALEPVMRACSGTWVAHGSGDADRETVDSQDHVAVPPDDPQYRIRRIWLTPEEEKGYYFGFANEGLWPLCHIAHTRPIFRSADFETYRRVNERFSDAVTQEAKTENPVILVQDYHFGLLPGMIRRRLPKATIITFWHIPWPNAESFGICPWKEEILEGLLGSSILGFHTRFHCNNFLDAVDRYLEARIHRDDLTVSHEGHLTAVRNYPISIAWPRPPDRERTIEHCRQSIRSRHGLPEHTRIGLGVDRLDYTKGILERFAAIERTFELYPEWIGRLAFIQIGAPTRSSIPHYKQFNEELQALMERINSRYSSPGYPPIILMDRHHEPDQIAEYYRGADFCFVSSLHDGMNLVAKEFVAARDDENGVLILSQFTGAARELPEALLVNPYDSDQCAEAIHQALLMPPEQRRGRMRNMRAFIQEFNVFRWAARMLLDAARIRQRSLVLGSDQQAAPRE